MDNIIRRYLYLEKTTMGPSKKMRNGKWKDYWIYNYYEAHLVKMQEFEVDKFEVVNAHPRLLEGEFPHVKVGQFSYRSIPNDFVDIQYIVESVNGFEYACIYNVDGTMFISRRIYGPPDNYLVREVL